MSRLRWRLVRWIAPTAIMQDPFEGEAAAAGVFVFVRNDGLVMSYRADRFRLRSRTRLPKAWRDPEARVYGDYARHFSTTHFAGTVAR